MLVLSRHRDESIFIGDDIKVAVVDIRGDKVRIGIEAPDDVPIHREEIHHAIRREGRMALGAGQPATISDEQWAATLRAMARLMRRRGVRGLTLANDGCGSVTVALDGGNPGRVA